jgi:hypothetical protein
MKGQRRFEQVSVHVVALITKFPGLLVEMFNIRPEESLFLFINAHIKDDGKYPLRHPHEGCGNGVKQVVAKTKKA